VDGLLFHRCKSAFIHTTEVLQLWEGDEGCSISPDTGQHGGFAFLKKCKANSPTLAGTLVPGSLIVFYLP
jgi:hypothetical protein